MANLFSPTEDDRRLPGTSGAELTDLNPEQAYDTDLRRINEEDRVSAQSVNRKQDRVARFMKSAKAAGAYKQRASIDEPTIRGRTPIGKASIAGMELPSQRSANYGDPGAGGTSYARKPQPSFGRSFV